MEELSYHIEKKYNITKDDIKYLISGSYCDVYTIPDNRIIRVYTDTDSFQTKTEYSYNFVEISILREICFNQFLKGDNIIVPHEIAIDGNINPYFVMERMDGDLYNRAYLQQFNKTHFYSLLRSMLCALRSIHQHHLIHSDIKPGNIFFKKINATDLIYKLGDMNLVQHNVPCSQKKYSRFTTYATRYYSPEKELRNPTTDIFMLGATLLVVTLNNRKLERKQINCTVLQKYKNEIMSKIDPLAYRILELMLKDDNRIYIDQIEQVLRYDNTSDLVDLSLCDLGLFNIRELNLLNTLSMVYSTNDKLLLKELSADPDYCKGLFVIITKYITYFRQCDIDVILIELFAYDIVLFMNSQNIAIPQNICRYIAQGIYFYPYEISLKRWNTNCPEGWDIACSTLQTNQYIVSFLNSKFVPHTHMYIRIYHMIMDNIIEINRTNLLAFISGQ